MLRLSVVIATLNRPDCVQRCLDALLAQEPRPQQVIVVDSSPDSRTDDVVKEFMRTHGAQGFDDLIYQKNTDGYLCTPNSRNKGLLLATGDVIAMIDDDAFVREGWAARFLEAYETHGPELAAVGGRVLNIGQPIPTDISPDTIGRFYPDGNITGHFDADAPGNIYVDHLMGANMSFRREALARVGGFRQDQRFGVSGVREETEVFVRFQKLGLKVLYVPGAVVDHLGAPQAFGNRFDLRYRFWTNRNHAIMTVRNHGVAAPILWRNIAKSSALSALSAGKKVGGAVAGLGVEGAGWVVGLAMGLNFLRKSGKNPILNDPLAQQIREKLSQPNSVSADKNA